MTTKGRYRASRAVENKTRSRIKVHVILCLDLAIDQFLWKLLGAWVWDVGMVEMLLDQSAFSNP